MLNRSGRNEPPEPYTLILSPTVLLEIWLEAWKI